MHLHTLHEPGFSHGSYLRVTPHNQVKLNLSVFCTVMRKLCQAYENYGGKKIIYCCDWQPQTRFKSINKPHDIYAQPPYSYADMTCYSCTKRQN